MNVFTEVPQGKDNEGLDIRVWIPNNGYDGIELTWHDYYILEAPAMLVQAFKEHFDL